MRHGYYLATTKSEHGDAVFSALSGAYWERSGLTATCKVEGVSIWDDGLGVKVRAVVRDMFGNASACYPPAPPFEIPRIHVWDVPQSGEEKP